jgi:hypothetical protein
MIALLVVGMFIVFVPLGACITMSLLSPTPITGVATTAVAIGQITPATKQTRSVVVPTADSTGKPMVPSQTSTNSTTETIATASRDTATPTSTNTIVPTNAATHTPTPIPTNTSTVTPTSLPTDTPTVTSTPLPTDTPTATPTPLPPTKTPRPTPTLTVLELVQGSIGRVAKEKFGDGLISAKAAKVAGSIVVTVDYDLGFLFDEEDAARVSSWNLKQFAPSVFSDSGIDTLELRSFTDFKDLYGNTQKEVAFKFTITRSLATKVNWPEVDPRRIGLLLQSEKAGNGVYVHPVLEAAWLKYQQGG